ncbi:MAG TPA: sigma-70 family RNA polymerase sigma factor [Verrucomicrobiales bacterium]|nr:sigma-70 family RNA polymerase sigma factor [Verrucomicrobiales bacterium]
MNLPDSNLDGAGGPGKDSCFATTHWSVVLAAGQEDSLRTSRALETLCQTYWPPIYRYLRRMGHSEADAKDLTQEFFAYLLRKNLPGRADPAKGRFRSFLLHTLKQFVADQRSKARAQKRGGKVVLVSLDVHAEECRGPADLAGNPSPERVFERRWVEIILAQVASRLEQQYAATGRKDLFDHLQTFQPGEQPEISYEEAAKRLELSLPAVKSAIHRLRRRHGELLREEIAQTVSTPAEIDEELRSFVSCWSR